MRLNICEMKIVKRELESVSFFPLAMAIFMIKRMFSFRRLLLLLLIAFLAYCFWPRRPSMTDFDPQRMSQLQIKVWKETPDKKLQGPILPLYEIYQGQYHLPPVAALKMAFEMSRALHIFRSSPDAADQEKALVPLQTAFLALQSGTKASFDPTTAARMELTIWLLRTDYAKRAQLVTAWSESIALLCGHTADECLPAAKKFSVASKLADEGKWDEAQSNLLDAWKSIKSLKPAAK